MSLLKQFKSHQAYSLIEFAATLVVLFPVIFGAIDINNALQAYTALQEGANTALRCIYPTDGACNKQDYSPPARLYNWYRQDNTNELYVRKNDYSGDSYWMNYPQYTFNQFQVFTLGNVSYNLPRYNYYARSVNRAGAQQLHAVMQTSTLPLVTSNNNGNLRERSRNPIFKYLHDNSNYPEVLSMTSNRTIERGGRYRFRLQIADPSSFVDGTLCFRSAGIDREKAPFDPNSVNNPNQHNPVFSDTCNSSGFARRYGTGSSARLIIWVSGQSTSGSGPTELTMKIVRRNGNGSYEDITDLGGQEFSDTASDRSPVHRNFVPRGIPSNQYLDEDLVGHAPNLVRQQCGRNNDNCQCYRDGHSGPTRSCNCYGSDELCCADNDTSCLFEYRHDTIRVPYNDNSYYLEIAAGNTFPANRNYVVTGIHVYAPQFQDIDFIGQCALVGCSGANPDATCNPEFNGARFGDGGNGTIRYSLSPTVQNPAVLATGSFNRSVSYGNQFAISGTNLHMAPFFSDSDAHSGYIGQFQGESSCEHEEMSPSTRTSTDALSASNSCPDGNHGVPVNASQDEKQSVCPLLNSNIDQRGASPVNILWTEVAKTVPSADQINTPGWTYSFNYNYCGKSFNFVAPTNLAQYPHRNDPSSINQANSVQYVKASIAGDVDPRDAKASDPTWNCPEMRVAHQRYDGIVPPTPTPGNGGDYINPGIPQFVNADTTSLLNGERYELNSSDASCYDARVKSAVRELGTTNGMPDFAYIVPHSTYLREDKIAVGVEKDAVLSDSCIPYRVDTITNAEILLASNVSETDPAPSECSQQGVICRRKFAGYGSDAGHAATVDYITARQMALEEVAAAYPRTAGDSCPNQGNVDMDNVDANKPCINISGNPDSDREVSVTAQMKVPLNLLAGHSFTMSYAARRTFEREYAK